MPTLSRTLAAVGATGLAAAGLLSAAPAHATTGTSIFQIKVTEVLTSHTQSWSTHELPKAGDTFSFTGNLRQFGNRVGKDAGTCRFRTIYGNASAPTSARIRCDVVFHFFKRGSIEAAGTRTIAWDKLVNSDFIVTIPVIGGTNHYRNAGGTVKNEQLTATKARLTFRLTGVS